MEQSNLSRDFIAQPELWRLVLMLDRKALHCALYPPVAREQLIWRTFAFDSAAPSTLRAIEDIIYDNPLLLCDFRQVDCIVADTPSLLVPAEAPADDYELLFAAANPSADTATADIIADKVADNATLLSLPDPDITAFLQRTFYNIRFHRSTPLLASYFTRHSDSLPQKRVIVLTDGDRLTLLALSGNSLLASNTFVYSKPADAAYYILASMQQTGLDPADNDTAIAFWGESLTANDTIAAILRPYAARISPVPFPTLRHRASKNTLDAPFPLLIMPLCE